MTNEEGIFPFFLASKSLGKAQIVWMAGGGIRGGTIYGATDEFGFRAVEDRVQVRDLHATILHLMGLDHSQLTYYFQGLEQRLTQIDGDCRVIREVIA